MSLFFRATSEARDISSLPWNHGGDRLSSSSMTDQLSLVPVFAATRLISESVASLPLQAYRRTGDGRQRIALPAVLEAPSAYGTRMEWVQRCMMSLLLRGNAYGLRVGGIRGSIEWLHPDKVRYDETTRRWTYDGHTIEPGELLHIPALTVPGSTLGLSPVGACVTTTRTGLETQRFMRDWFRNKAIPGMRFKNTEVTLKADEAQKVKERMQATMRAGEPFVTGKDWDLDVITLPAEHAGFIESARLNATQVANIYGVPPEMIGGESGSSMTYSTTEMQQIQFLTHTLRPWITRLEAAFSSLLPAPQYVKFNVDAMIRVDTKTRHEVYRLDREIGLRNLDEIRALEDLEPLPGGQGEDYTPLKTSAPTKETA